MITSRQKLVIFLVAWLPVLVMMAASISYVICQYRRVVDHASVFLEDELSRRLNREVKISSTSVTPFGEAVLMDVEIAAEKKLAEGRIIEVKEVRIKYDPRALVFGNKGAQSISSILVVDPTIYLIRRKNGTFNVQDLLKRPPGPVGKPFKGEVRVRNATLIFRDYLAKTKPLPAMNRVYEVQGFMSAADFPIYRFRGSGRGAMGRLQSADVVGTYNKNSKIIDVDLDAREAGAAYWSSYFGLSRSLNVRSGTLRVIAGIHLSKSGGKKKMLLSGAVRISNASVLLPIMNKPVTGINGIAALNGQNIILSLTGGIAHSNLRVTGTIRGFTKPKVDMSVTTTNADFASLVAAFKLPKNAQQLHASGRGPAYAKITGLASSPMIAVHAKVPQVGIQGYTVRNLDISAKYDKGVVAVSSSAFTWRGARFVASGLISATGKQNLSVQGQATGINIATLPLPYELRAKGNAKVGFSVTGTIANPTIQANVNVVKGAFDGIPIQAARASITYSWGRFRVASFEVMSKTAGVVTGSGEVSAKNISLVLAGKAINLASIGRVLGLDNLSGIGYIAGTVKGPIRAPTFFGAIEVFAAGWGQYKVDYARLEFTTDMKTVTVKSGVARLFPAEFKFSGTASGLKTDRIAFRASGRIERLTISTLADLLGRKIDMSGTLVGSFNASGVYLTNRKLGQSPLQDAAASAQLKLEDGSAFGYPITEATARFNLIGNRLEVSEAMLTSQDAKATLGGSLLLDTGTISLTFGISGFDLARLQNYTGKYAVVSGSVNTEGSITGVLANPKIRASANVDDLIVNYIKFDIAKVEAEYKNGLVETFSTLLKKGRQSILVHANGYNPDTNCLISADGTIENVSVSEFWSMFRAAPYWRSGSGARLRGSIARMPRLTSGELNGSLSLSGCLADPSGVIHLAAFNVGVDTRQIDTIVLDASMSDGIVILKQLRASAGTTSVVESGRYEIEKRQIELDVVASNLDLSHLRPWLGANTPGGTMAADFVVRGNIASPSVIGSVEVVRPSFGGLMFDALRASRIEVTRDRVEFADVILASGSHQVIARGYLPWSWSTLAIPSNKPIEMVAQLNRQDLSVLASFSSMIEPGGTTGSVEAMLSVTGTLANPVMTGSLTVQNGVIALRNFANQFNNINVDVSFDGNRVVVNQFSVASSMGGTLSIVPGGYIAIGQGGTSETSLLVAANGLAISERNALGMQEDVSLQLDAGLSVTGDPKAPLVANANFDGIPGGITIHDARIAFMLPQIPENESLLAPTINPGFDVAVRIGQNVVVAPPNMTLTIAGGGHIGGNLARPDVLFDDVSIQEGNLRLATSRLTVTSGGKLYLHYAPPADTEVRVDFQATTTVTAMNSLGQRQRYAITVAVSGPVSNLEIKLSSTPSDLSKEQMLAALGHVSGIFATGETGLQNELGNILTAVGTSTIFAPVESLFVRQLGFEQFSIEYSLGQPLALYVSRRLFGNLYVSYYGYLTSDFTSPSDVAYLVGLSYKINPNYQASVFVDDQQNGSFQVQYTQLFR